MHLVMFVKVLEETLLCRCRYVDLMRKNKSREKCEQGNAEEEELSPRHGDWGITCSWRNMSVLVGVETPNTSG